MTLSLPPHTTNVSSFVDSILTKALSTNASDIHFESEQGSLVIRFRIDGILSTIAKPPTPLTQPIINHIKVLGNLDMAEYRVPQDGRLTATIDAKKIDFRISTLPIERGESIVLRVLKKQATSLSLEELGMPSEIQAAYKKHLLTNSGLIIVTGPTGSGKTTTLYSGLNLLNDNHHKIVTIEDPVEYELEGLTQINTNPIANLNFATALRALLRHDPDVIMVGEIRDSETAKIATQAALTGHKVLTTLHTQDSISAISRLRNLEIDPLMIASTLRCTLAQRLVRILCPHCREATSTDELEYTPKGCPLCSGSGHQGRIGIFEILEIDTDIQDLILSNTSVNKIRQTAKSKGFQTLQKNAEPLVTSGITSRREVLCKTSINGFENKLTF